MLRIIWVTPSANFTIKNTFYTQYFFCLAILKKPAMDQFCQKILALLRGRASFIVSSRHRTLKHFRRLWKFVNCGFLYGFFKVFFAKAFDVLFVEAQNWWHLRIVPVCTSNDLVTVSSNPTSSKLIAYQDDGILTMSSAFFLYSASERWPFVVFRCVSCLMISNIRRSDRLLSSSLAASRP